MQFRILLGTLLAQLSASPAIHLCHQTVRRVSDGFERQPHVSRGDAGLLRRLRAERHDLPPGQLDTRVDVHKS